MTFTDDQLYLIAKVCQDANHAFAKANGDMTTSRWIHADKERRDQMIRAVVNCLAKPNATPKEIHDIWKETVQVDGWKYGPVKDYKAKTHPCICAWEDLPEWQVRKDLLFMSIVKALTQPIEN